MKSQAAQAKLLGMRDQGLGEVLRGKREASVGFKWRVRLAARLADSEGTGNWHIEPDRKKNDYFHVVFPTDTMLEFRGGKVLAWSVLRPDHDMRVRFASVPPAGWGEPELTTLEGDEPAGWGAPELTTLEGDKPAGVWELRVGADRRGITVSDLSPGGEGRPQWQLSPESVPGSFALPPALPGDTELFSQSFGTGVRGASGSTHLPAGGADPVHRLLRWLANPDGPALEAWQESLTLLEKKHQATSPQAKASLLGMRDQGLGEVLRGKREASVGFKWRVRLAVHLTDPEGTGTGSEGTRNWRIETDQKKGDHFHVVFGETTMLEFHGGDVRGWSVLRPGHDMRVRFASVLARAGTGPGRLRAGRHQS